MNSNAIRVTVQVQPNKINKADRASIAVAKRNGYRSSFVAAGQHQSRNFGGNDLRAPDVELLLRNTPFRKGWALSLPHIMATLALCGGADPRKMDLPRAMGPRTASCIRLLFGKQPESQPLGCSCVYLVFFFASPFFCRCSHPRWGWSLPFKLNNGVWAQLRPFLCFKLPFSMFYAIGRRYEHGWTPWPALESAANRVAACWFIHFTFLCFFPCFPPGTGWRRAS